MPASLPLPLKIGTAIIVTTDIHELPNELLEKICFNLGLPEAYDLATSSKRFYEACRRPLHRLLTLRRIYQVFDPEKPSFGIANNIRQEKIAILINQVGSDEAFSCVEELIVNYAYDDPHRSCTVSIETSQFVRTKLKSFLKTLQVNILQLQAKNALPRLYHSARMTSFILVTHSLPLFTNLRKLRFPLRDWAPSDGSKGQDHALCRLFRFMMRRQPRDMLMRLHSVEWTTRFDSTLLALLPLLGFSSMRRLVVSLTESKYDEWKLIKSLNDTPMSDLRYLEVHGTCSLDALVQLANKLKGSCILKLLQAQHKVEDGQPRKLVLGAIGLKSLQNDWTWPPKLTNLMEGQNLELGGRRRSFVDPANNCMLWESLVYERLHARPASTKARNAVKVMNVISTFFEPRAAFTTKQLVWDDVRATFLNVERLPAQASS